jgi:hypothetical protein
MLNVLGKHLNFSIENEKSLIKKRSIFKNKYYTAGLNRDERSKACTAYDRLNIEIAGSNPARGMDVCRRLSVLCCPVFR